MSGLCQDHPLTYTQGSTSVTADLALPHCPNSHFIHLFYQFYFFPICSLYLVQTFKMVYVIALTSKLVFLLATFTRGQRCLKKIKNCHLAWLSFSSLLCQSPQESTPICPLLKVLWPWAEWEVVCLLCNFSLSTDCFPSQGLPVLLELVSICKWFNPRKFLLENICSHQVTYTLYTLVRVYNISEETYNYLRASQKCLKGSWRNDISGAILKTFFQLTSNTFIQAKGRK